MILGSIYFFLYVYPDPFVVIYTLENRGEFLEKLQRARNQIKTGVDSQPILSVPSSTRIMVGNWALTCKKEGELHIHNSDGQQVCTDSVVEEEGLCICEYETRNQSLNILHEHTDRLNF
jgi:hypothetical protein